MAGIKQKMFADMDKILRRLKLIFSIGTIKSNTQATQQVEFSLNELNKNIQFAQSYGLEVYPLPGAKAVTIFNGGDRSHGISIAAADKRYTHTLEPGDVMLYDKRSQFVHLKDSGIDINCVGKLNIKASSDITIKSDTDIALKAPHIGLND